MNWILIFIGLTFANFLYAFVRDKDFEAAYERSYFQGAAMLTVYLAQPWT